MNNEIIDEKIYFNLENNDLKINYVNLQKMTFIYNALENGWEIKKKNNKYSFSKKHEGKKEYINEQKNCQNEDDLNLYKNIEERIKDLKEEQRIWNDDNKEWIKLVEKMLTDVKEIKEMFEERSQWCDLRSVMV